MIAVLSWTTWSLAVVGGLRLFFLQSAKMGLAKASLPRLLYFLWILACVLILGVLRTPVPAAMALGLAVAAVLQAMIRDEPARDGRAAEIAERVEGCRRALKEDERNAISLELLGDIYSTMEDKALALKYWGLANEIWSQAKLLEKIEFVNRPEPFFFRWGSPCARELKACPGCERVGSRLDYSCPRCGESLFTNRGDWAAVRFNRVYEWAGAGAVVETGLALLPFLFFCEPWAYALAWLVWIGACRPGPETAA